MHEPFIDESWEASHVGRPRPAPVAFATDYGPRATDSFEEKINAVKRLAVSTGQLRRLLALHIRPIDLVVFQEPSL